MNSKILITKANKDYELLDSGDGYKLERFGEVVLSRPDPQALWKKSAPDKWDTVAAEFKRGEGSSGKTGSWKKSVEIPASWPIEMSGIKFNIKPTPFKHVGIFPEQSANWDWMKELVKARPDAKVLNLFGYTGGATLACADAGADVTHVDSSKAALNWANENAESSGLKDKPIRWILEDAASFVKKEVKRGKKYDAIIMDPPAFGHGDKGETWKIEDDFVPFFDMTMELLSDNPLFVLVNGYASGYSPLAYENNLKAVLEKYGGQIESGELAILESGSGRLLPCGIFSRWFK